MLKNSVYCLTIWGSIQTWVWRFDSLNIDTPETYMWEVQHLENDRGLPNLSKAYRLYNKNSPRLI